MQPLRLIVVLVFATPGSSARADNWGHWRGPTGNGTAATATPPIEWSATKNVRWKVALPAHDDSSPVVWGNQAFVTTAVPIESKSALDRGKYEFIVLCFQRNDGKLLWRRTAAVAKPHQRAHASHGYASASPCTDGNLVFAHFGSRGLFCYSMTGELVWKRDDFGKMDILNEFGEGSSPTVEGEKILVPWDHRGPSALYALDKRTGTTIWMAKRDEPTGWATPLVVEHAGKKQVVMNGQRFARSYDLETGKELWRCGGQTVRPVASPVAGNGLVYVGSGFQGAFLGAFRLDGVGDIKGSDKVVWTIKQDAPDVASLLLTSGRLYFHKRKTGLFSCVDAATGKFHYAARRIDGLADAVVYASPIAAGGHIYLTATNGTTVVIKDSAELNVVATNSVGEFVGATPAPVGKQLFLRGAKHLFCIAQ